MVLTVLTAVVAVAVPTYLLVRFHGNPMSQVWILSLSVCSYVFLFLMRIWRERWFFTELARLSYLPLLASWSASAIGSTTTTVFVLFFAAVWAAGNLGYSLAVHRLDNGTEPDIHAASLPDIPTMDRHRQLCKIHYIRAPFMWLLWTLCMAEIISIDPPIVSELNILSFLSYFGWVHVTVWVIFFAMVPMHGFPIQDLTEEWLIPVLLSWMLVSPLIFALFHQFEIVAVLCHLLLMLALVAYLSYNNAVYMHFLWTASERY